MSRGLRQGPLQSNLGSPAPGWKDRIPPLGTDGIRVNFYC